MFKSFSQTGTTVEVQGLICHLPPVGWVPDYLNGNGKLKKVGVYQSDIRAIRSELSVFLYKYLGSVDNSSMFAT